VSEQTSLRVLGLDELRSFLEGSPVATLVFGLPDQRVRIANEAVAELIGSPRSAIVGLRPAQVWAAGDARRAETALSDLAVGALDSYRARRRLRTGAAPLASRCGCAICRSSMDLSRW